jgi:hypothetical protein
MSGLLQHGRKLAFDLVWGVGNAAWDTCVARENALCGYSATRYRAVGMIAYCVGYHVEDTMLCGLP